MDKISSELCHKHILDNKKPALEFNESCDYEAWRAQVKEKLTELMGDVPEEKVPLNITIEWEKEHDDFIEKRILFDSEEYTTVPCHLWIPKNAKKPCPAVICLQGHSTGMHISMGRAKYEGDENLISGGDRDFAVQIIKEGYAALVLEQRAFGERKSQANAGCALTAPIALLHGRTLLRERVWDVSCAIDMLETIKEIDSDRIACMGNSGGGTATYYAACLEDRIKIAMPSCSVCTFDESIAAMHHCICNYIPNMLKYFDMGDIACLIAPKKLVVVAGEQDTGFRIKGTMEAYSTIEKIYKKAGVPDNCRLVLGKEGHRFYADPSWKVFKELSGWE